MVEDSPAEADSPEAEVFLVVLADVSRSTMSRKAARCPEVFQAETWADSEVVSV